MTGEQASQTTEISPREWFDFVVTTWSGGSREPEEAAYYQITDVPNGINFVRGYADWLLSQELTDDSPNDFNSATALAAKKMVSTCIERYPIGWAPSSPEADESRSRERTWKEVERFFKLEAEAESKLAKFGFRTH